MGRKRREFKGVQKEKEIQREGAAAGKFKGKGLGQGTRVLMRMV